MDKRSVGWMPDGTGKWRHSQYSIAFVKKREDKYGNTMIFAW